MHHHCRRNRQMACSQHILHLCGFTPMIQPTMDKADSGIKVCVLTSFVFMFQFSVNNAVRPLIYLVIHITINNVEMTHRGMCVDMCKYYSILYKICCEDTKLSGPWCLQGILDPIAQGCRGTTNCLIQ